MRIPSFATLLFPLLVSCPFATITFPAWSRDYFDPALLSLGSQAVVTDLSAFETAGFIPPGTYLVTLYVNQQELGQHNIVFSSRSEREVTPELTPAFLAEVGVNIPALSAFSGLPENKPVSDLSALIPEAKVHFDFQQQRLELSIPQVAMKPNTRDSVDPALWDDGVPAFLLNYNINAGRNRQSRQPGSNQTNLFAGLNGGLNWQQWRLRSNMTYSRNENKAGDGGKQLYQNTSFSNTYLLRDIRAWRSEILAGEHYTGDEVFDSIPFRGIKLSSSEDMKPVNLRGFAPVITGIAQSNAQVSISQNGNMVYQSFVAPGPFRINDLYQTGSSGDLTITVTEADGSVRTWRQAFSALPVMQRPGGLKYELTTGKYNGGITVGSREDEFVLGSLIYGLPHNLTLYGGGLGAKDYNSVALGTGVSLGYFGALSADVTTSSATINGSHRNGQSFRMRYAKSMLTTGTSADLTAYRYSTQHYYNFSDFNNFGYRLRKEQAPWALARQRSEFQIRVSQQLGHLGSLYLSGTRSNYWNTQQQNTTLSSGYNKSWRGVSADLAYSINRIKSGGHWPQNRQLALNLQVPFSFFSSAQSRSRTYASSQTTYNNQGSAQQQVGISGAAVDDRLSYSMMQSLTKNDNNRASSTLNLGWQGSKGTARLGYSSGSHYNALNLNGTGGLVVHPEGVTTSQLLGTSIALVNAPRAKGVKILNGNIQTNSRGYAVVPYLSAYQKNTITLNSATLPDNVDLTQSSVNVVPTKGAVVVANFATRIGYQALITLTREGVPVPFGAIVTVDGKGDNNSGIVGDSGQVYLSGLPEQGRLKIMWGPDASQQCHTDFNLNGLKISENSAIRMLNIKC